jgi:hypothetical protein
VTNPAPKYPNRAAELRARLLSQPVEPNRPVVVGGETFFIRTPMMNDRTRIGELAGQQLKAVANQKDGKVEVDLTKVPMAAMYAAAIITLVVDDVGNPCFTQVDFEALQNQPAGGWVNQLGELCFAAANGEKKDVAAAPGVTSEKTPDSASTASSPTV